MTVIIDYGVGNLYSLCGSLSHLGDTPCVTADPETIARADRIILPGVGAFGDAWEKLNSTGLIPVIKDAVTRGVPLLGICLGMQLLFDVSYEYGCHPGLGLIPGKVCPLAEGLPKGTKVPHMGWNALNVCREDPLLKYVQEGDHVYYVHSFYAKDCTPSTLSTTD